MVTLFNYRTVALELANQEEAELLSVISDVKGFLKRPEGIPAYVSKEELFGELSKIVKSHNAVSTEKKVEAIEVSGQLLKAISSRKYRRRNSHVSTDVTSCLDIVIPTVILQLGSRSSGVSQASLKLIQQCLQNDFTNRKLPRIHRAIRLPSLRFVMLLTMGMQRGGCTLLAVPTTMFIPHLLILHV